MSRGYGIVIGVLVASACRPNEASSRQELSGFDASPGVPIDASGIDMQSSTIVIDPRAGHGNVNKPFKQVSQDRLVADLIHRYSKGATNIAHIRATNTTSRRNTDLPPRIVTDFDFTAVDLVVGSTPPAIRQTALGGVLNGITETNEWSPRVHENQDFVAFFREKRGVWTLIGLLPCDVSGTISIYGESITLAQLQVLAN